MNKRLLGGLLAAGIIGGGVYGFAATLDVTTDNLGAGNQDVSSCDADGVDVDYSVVWGGSEYEVDEVLVRGIDAACVGDSISVTLADDADGELGEQISESVTAGTMTFEFAGEDVSGELVENVHVAIAGGDS